MLTQIAEPSASDPDRNVRMACLTSRLPKQGSSCWVAGWGRTVGLESETKAYQLKQTSVKIMDREYCLANSGYPSSILKPEMICAGNLDNDNDGLTDEGPAPCLGDSGGPLICGENGRASLVGVVSFVSSLGCAKEGFPAGYSSAAYKGTYNWIRRTVNPTLSNLPLRFWDLLHALL